MSINREVKRLTPIIMKDFNTNIEITFHDIDKDLVEQMKRTIAIKDKENMGKSSYSGSGNSSQPTSPRSLKISTDP